MEMLNKKYVSKIIFTMIHFPDWIVVTLSVLHAVKKSKARDHLKWISRKKYTSIEIAQVHLETLTIFWLQAREKHLIFNDNK